MQRTGRLMLPFIKFLILTLRVHLPTFLDLIRDYVSLVSFLAISYH